VVELAVPYPYQEEGIDWIAENKRVILGDEQGTGKAQPLDAQVLTPAGWACIGDLKKGDEAFTPDGSRTTISDIFDLGIRDVYRVTFQDKSVSRCCLEHLWAVQNHNQRRLHQDFKIKSLGEISSRSLRMPGNPDMRRNYIPLIDLGLDLDCMGYVRPLHPYLLGALLGDGGFTSGQPRFTSVDRSIIERVATLLPKTDRLVKDSERGPDKDMRINGSSVKNVLQELGLWGHPSLSKFIPENYLWATFAERLQLLRGLMDTDGTASQGYATFNTSAPELASGMRVLVQSLGGTSTFSYRNNPVKNEMGQQAYNVQMRLPEGITPFTLPYKVELFENRKHQVPLRGIDSIELIGPAEVRCIKIQDPRGLYITDEFVVTHNTGQALLAWRKLGMPGPAAILGRANAQSVWLLQAPQWGVQTPQVISGTQKQRAREWADLDSTSLIAITPESLKSDVLRGVAPRKWGCIIYDQYQRLLINRKNDMAKFFKQELKTDVLMLLSGSPTRKNFADLWCALNIIDPKAFPSYWRFVRTFGLVIEGPWGWEVVGVREPDVFIRRIAKYYKRREKKDVAQWLPPKQRVLDHVLPMQPLQRKMYEELQEKMILHLSNDELLLVPSQLAMLTRLRQILVSPKILDPNFPEWGALLEDLGAMLEETDDHHFVVFTPFTAAIPIIVEYLQKVKKVNDGFLYTLQGGMKPQEVNEAVEQFKATKGVCICSIAYSEAFDLATAAWAYFCGFSWSVSDNLEAEDRLHRLTTQQPVTYYYPQHQGGVDLELVMPVIEGKATEILAINRSARALRDALLRAKARAAVINDRIGGTDQ
jgi:SNF2-related domain